MLIAQQTEFLLLDEPIAALDLAHQIEVLSLLRTLHRRPGIVEVGLRTDPSLDFELPEDHASAARRRIDPISLTLGCARASL